jgi:hypothetical protein
MKKTLITAALLCVAAGAFAQGTINFGNNFGATVFRAAIYGPELADPTRELHGQTSGTLSFPVGPTVYTGLRLDGARYTMELVVYNAAGAAFSASTAPFLTGGSAGFIASKLTLAMPTGFLAGTRPSFEIRAWDTQTGSTYAAAAIKGTTGVFSPNIPLGGVDVDGNLVLPSNLTGWTSFNIHGVPEPSTIALGVLGLGSLLLFRRRQAK